VHPQVASLRRLAHLDVSSNCLTALPECLPPSLTHLDASNNSRVVR
jgi:Leucine-rich repeat (LRR) protein